MGNITHRAGKCCAGNDEGTCGSRAAYSAVSAVRWSAGRRVCVGWVTRCDGIRAKYGCKEHSPQLDVGVSRRRCDEGTCGSRAAYSAVSAVRWSGGRRECDGIWGEYGPPRGQRERHTPYTPRGVAPIGSVRGAKVLLPLGHLANTIQEKHSYICKFPCSRHVGVTHN